MPTIKRFGILLALALAAGAVSALATPPSTSTGGDDVELMLARLEGGWYGEDNTTPLGPMSFVLLFDRQADGGLKARTSLNRETYVELEFERGADGRWMLREEAGMEGLGVQSYTLAPVGAVAGGQRWVYAENPAYLWVDVGLAEEVLSLDVTLRGEPHVGFELARMADEEIPEMRSQLELQASQAPAEGYSIADIVSVPAHEEARRASAAERPAEDETIGAARAAAAERPEDGQAHLDVARALGAAIQQSPAAGARYGYEMLAALERAIELEPGLAEAYHWLVGYYLNAPPIAGGSVEKAEETARRLAEFDPTGAEDLLRQIAARRDAP